MSGETTWGASGTGVDPSGLVTKTLFDANTILKADSDNTPAALTVAEQTLVGRIAGGVIAALTGVQVMSILASHIAVNEGEVVCDSGEIVYN